MSDRTGTREKKTKMRVAGIDLVRRYTLIIREVDRGLKIPDSRKKLRLRQV